MLLSLSLHNDAPPSELWYLYFNDALNGTEFAFEVNQQIIVRNDEAFVYDCFFDHVYEGVIYMYRNNSKLLHSNCYFKDCARTVAKNGAGAVYFGGNGSVVQRKFCGLNCSVNDSAGAVSITDLAVGGNGRNIISECSVTGTDNDKISAMMLIHYGIIEVSYFNSSYNKVLVDSGYEFSKPTGTSMCNFSSFAHNVEYDYIVIFNNAGYFKNFAILSIIHQ